MAKGKYAGIRVQLKAQRLNGLWECANIVSAIFVSAGKSMESPPSTKEIFDQLSGTYQPLIEESDDYDDGSSLAAAKAERRAREAAQIVN